MARYIKIKHRNDIDVTAITLQNINQRYIDDEGNRFATRFNKRTRKVDVIPIALGLDEVEQIQNRKRFEKMGKKIEKTKTNQSNAPTANKPSLGRPAWIANYKIKLDEELNFDSYLLALDSEIIKYSERLHGLMKQLSKFEAYNKIEDLGPDFLTECENLIERTVFEYILDAQNLAVELVRFPKPDSAYIVHMTKEQRKVYDSLKKQDDQKKILKACLITNTIFKAFGLVLDMLDKVIIEGYNLEDNAIPENLRSTFNDMLMTAGFIKTSIIAECGKLLQMLKIAEEVIP